MKTARLSYMITKELQDSLQTVEEQAVETLAEHICNAGKKAYQK